MAYDEKISDDKDVFLQRLLYRIKRRGHKETELRLSNFANNYLKTMDQQKLEEFFKVLQKDDLDVYHWIKQYYTR